MKIKTSELTGPALDWAVAKAKGWVNYPTDSVEQGMWWHTNPAIAPLGNDYYKVHRSDWNPSANWEQGGPIIEREKIGVMRGRAGDREFWIAEVGYADDYLQCSGPTSLIAAMRCYVMSKLGDEIEVPEELL